MYKKQFSTISEKEILRILVHGGENISSKRATDLHRREKLFELNFF